MTDKTWQTPTERSGILRQTQPEQQAFLCSLGEKNEERESKTARKVAQVKERGGGEYTTSPLVFLCSETKRKRLLRRLRLGYVRLCPPSPTSEEDWVKTR